MPIVTMTMSTDTKYCMSKHRCKMRKNKTETKSTKLLCSPLNLYRHQCEDKVAFCTMYML